jgi:UV excision repair protein RAD23
MVAQNPAMLQQMLPALQAQYPEIATAVQENPEAFMRMLQEAAVPGGGMPMPGGGMGGMAPNAAMMQQLAQNPEVLEQLLAEIQQTDPEVAAQIRANPQAFAQVMQEMSQRGMPPGTGGGMPGGGGQQVVRLSEEEIAAVQRLQDLGFDRNTAAQAYLACDKNEELAANFLFEQGLGDD